MKALVLYKSKTGFTQKYANWIAEELFADVCEASRITREEIENCEAIVYGGGLYAGNINGLDIIKKNKDLLKTKKVVVFATGASSARREVVDEIRNKNFSPEEQEKIKFFYFRGGFNYKRLKPLDKLIMKIMKWRLKLKKELNLDEKGLLAAYESPVDFTRKKNIEELVRFVKRKES